ncbi:hypothetical protein K438DRAFT_1981145 [Mycena galopus ATCC 62051]|nr:hypothetical protein K438DRAFT_1981145 [Mycena galopus ATCC 62051]
MAEHDDLLGSILIGSWIASILYGVTICKTWDYVASRSRTNERFRKALLLCCMVSTSVAMVGQFANVYYPTVTFWGNTTALETWYWPLPVYVLCTCSTGIMVNVFLINRLYRLCKNIWMALFLVCCVITGPAQADIFIAAALIWKLCTMQSEFQATSSLITRLVFGAIQTGATTSTVALGMMVTYYICKDGSNAPTAFSYLIGPLYVLTLLYNLNLRPRDDGQVISLTVDFSRDDVQRTAMVSIDPPDENTQSRVESSRSFSTDGKIGDDPA